MSYHVEQSIEIQADRDKVFDAIADFNTWTTWSPWLCCDRAAKVTVTDDSSSENSQYHWVGPVVGEGEIQHEKLVRGELIDQELRFIKPFKSVSRVWFDIEQAGGGTKVTWHMKGNLPWFLFWMKAGIQRFISMDYNRGLKMLKEFVEQGEVASDTEVLAVTSVGPYRVVGVRNSCVMKDIGPSMDAAFGRLEAKMKASSLPMDGEMLTIYHKLDMKTQVMQYTAGYVVPRGTTVSDSSLAVEDLPQGEALHVKHTGRYEHLGNAWSAAHANLRHMKLKISKSCGGFEIYRNSPNDTDAKDLVTDLYIPVR